MGSEIFIPGTEPTDHDDFYQVFEIDRRTGLLANETPPETVRVRYILNGERIGMVSSAPRVLWWQLEAELADDTIQISEAVPFEVANYAPLEARELEPSGEQDFIQMLFLICCDGRFHVPTTVQSRS